jgi:hypothetical protein
MDRVNELGFFFFLYMTRRNGQLNTCTLSNALTNSQTGTNNQEKCGVSTNDTLRWWS